ncbi:MAG: cation:proton antiporter [Acidobacteriota bacterium]|nr:cation:proton antiporter [Acidobacteriota bacterium]MDH3529721.1 cation:proton antiporter [Acidobacteriota bacterium]
MKRRNIAIAAALAMIVLLPINLLAAGGHDGHGLDPTVLVGVALILIASTMTGEIFEKFGQPAVLGELFAGIVLGNLILLNIPYAEPFKSNTVIAALAQIGVIILLFEVGLETNLREMLKVGTSSLLVAIIGVVFPFFSGWAVAYIFIPEGPTLSHIFIGAMITATSIGITARVLSDLGHIHRREARIILGAAVIDDILALLLFGIVRSAVATANSGKDLDFGAFAIIIVTAIGFLLAAIIVGAYVMPGVFRSISTLESPSFVVGISIAICFMMAFFATKVGLAAIIGAFAAGMILDEAHFKHFIDHRKHHLQDFLKPLTALLTPIFFVWVGLSVDLGAFGRPSVLIFAGVLTLVAIVSKLAAGFGALGRSLNRFAIGFGMIPRGEVGLIFATLGAALTLKGPDGTILKIVDADTFSAVVILSMVTTMITPPLLKWSLGEDPHRTQVDQSPDEFE